MLTATVIGSVWATRRLTGLPSGAFLEVEVEAGNGQRGHVPLGLYQPDRVISHH